MFNNNELENMEVVFIATKGMKREIKKIGYGKGSLFFSSKIGMYIRYEKIDSIVKISFDTESCAISLEDYNNRVKYLFDNDLIKIGNKVRIYVKRNGNGFTKEVGLEVYELIIEVYGNNLGIKYKGLLYSKVSRENLNPYLI